MITRPGTTVSPIAVDRLATWEEIREAISADPDNSDEIADELAEEFVGQLDDENDWEIPADLGGYVRIASAEVETLRAFEEWLDEKGLGRTN